MELRVMVEPQQGATYEQQLRVALHAEALGFGAFFRSDHFKRIGPGDPGPGPTDSWVTLGALARETSTIRLGTMLSSATFRLPGVLAVQVAQVDQMSAGRVELGLGSGWFEDEHTAYGIPFPDVSERAGRWEEQLAVLSGVLSCPPGGQFSYSGRYYQLEGCPGLPRAVQQPRPPMVIGGMGQRRTPRLAATYADEFNIPFNTVENASAQYERVREACRSRGRDESSMIFSVALTLAVGRSDAEARDKAASIGEDIDALRSGGGLVGTPSEVLDRIHAFKEVGASRVYVQLKDFDDLASMDLIAEQVLPTV
ncbi:MAG TPA: LLM class F420-dependent oxidoreductase [Acidimicrobiales bacterium]|nr:LLM class F420-dependent oxidoreductase [Acidimicrobiales bacterium]